MGVVGTGIGARVDVGGRVGFGGRVVLVGGRSVAVGGNGVFVAVGRGGGSVGVAVARRTRRVAVGGWMVSVGCCCDPVIEETGVGVAGWFGQRPGPVSPLL